jgi:hypothetical protein
MFLRNQSFYAWIESLQCFRLYRAVDKAGRTADFLPSKKRDIVAAKRLFAQATRRPSNHHAGRLRGLSTGRRQTQRDWNVVAPRMPPILQVCEQRDWAGPSPDQTTGAADARVQVVLDRSRDGSGHRAGRAG